LNDEHEDEINENKSSPEDEDEDDEDNSSPEDEDEDEASEVESVAPENPSREDEEEKEISQVESVAPENRADEEDPLPTTRSGCTYNTIGQSIFQKLHILNIARAWKAHGHAPITLMIQMI